MVVRVFVVVAAVRSMPMAVVHIVHVIAVGHRLVPTPGPVLVKVLLGHEMPTRQPRLHRRASERDHRKDPDGAQHDGAPGGGVGIGGDRHSAHR